MKFENVLLALLARHSGTGYDLGQWLAGVGMFIRANADQSQIYKTLRHLREQGYVDFVVEERESAPNAKVYSPTPKGIEHLFALAAADYSPPARWQEPDFTIHYALFGALRPDLAPRLIDTELEFRRAQIARFRNRDRTLVLDDENADLSRSVATRVFEDMHELNSATLDAWIAQLERLRERWSSEGPEH